ncbi:MAG: Holliday junction resolvase RuvX [Sterolibacteriaceae bacterium]|nr:Holliday junction resolvase RuvX [Candidatus Methylophosphatis haderslevensis]
MREHPAQPALLSAQPAAASETILAFDFGEKRIGVAVGESLVGIARPLTTIAEPASEARFAAIGRLIGQWQPARLVVGLPCNDEAGEHAIGTRCRRFANQLHGRFGLPVALVDERYSSLEADAALKQQGAGWRDRKAVIDAHAAKVILQAYLQEQHGTARG